MALLFLDGFEADDLSVKWTSVNSVTTTTSSTRFNAGRATASSATNQTITKAFTASSQMTAGFAMLVGGSSTSNAAGIQLLGDSSVTAHLTLLRNSASSLLELRRGTSSGTLLATGTTSLVLNAWYYIEIQATIADAGGTVKVRLNGASTDEINFTGDTKNAGTNTTIDGIHLFSQSSMNGRFDDLYILNSTGSSNTTFLGDIRVQTVVPSGNGTHSQLVGSDGNSTDNYQLVDEQPYSTADYTGSDVIGNRDTYAMGDLLASTATVKGVQNNIIAAKSDSGAASAKSALLLGGTLYYGSNRTLTTSYLTYHDPYDTNPNTSTSWTATDVNNAEGGMEVV